MGHFARPLTSLRILPTYDRPRPYRVANSPTDPTSPVSSIFCHLKGPGQGDDDRPTWANVGRGVGFWRQDDLLATAAAFEFHRDVDVERLAVAAQLTRAVALEFGHQRVRAVQTQADEQAVPAEDDLLRTDVGGGQVHSSR